MSDSTAQAAGAMVIFGISGDLARKMTFRSLYRLEARDLIGCPVIGVAQDGWTDDQLRTAARKALDESGEAVQGSWGPATANDLVRGHPPWHLPWLPNHTA
jgi:glucose-6-phosphate 1-dehydrogenase